MSTYAVTIGYAWANNPDRVFEFHEDVEAPDHHAALFVTGTRFGYEDATWDNFTDEKPGVVVKYTGVAEIKGDA